MLLASKEDELFVHIIATDSKAVNQRLGAFLEEAPQLRVAGFRPGICTTYWAEGGVEDFSLCRVSRNSPP